jgi:hypothetical protein
LHYHGLKPITPVPLFRQQHLKVSSFRLLWHQAREVMCKRALEMAI